MWALGDQSGSFNATPEVGFRWATGHCKEQMNCLESLVFTFGGSVGQKPSSAPSEMQPQVPMAAREALMVMELGVVFVHGIGATSTEVLAAAGDDNKCE